MVCKEGQLDVVELMMKQGLKTPKNRVRGNRKTQK